jgi:tetratricopeptide (TPR) repeat protein
MMSDNDNDINSSSSSSEMTTLLTLTSGGVGNCCAFDHHHHDEDEKQIEKVSNDRNKNNKQSTGIQFNGRRRNKKLTIIITISLLLIMIVSSALLILSPQRRCFCCQFFFQEPMNPRRWKNSTTTASTLNDHEKDDDEWIPDVIFGNYSMPITFDDYDIDDYGDIVIDGTDASSSSSSSSSSKSKISSSSDIQSTFDTGLMECYGFANFEARKTASKLLSYTTTTTTTNTHITTSSSKYRHLYYCPMCYWLLAMGYSPIINHPIISNRTDYENAAKAASIAFKEAHHSSNNNNNNISSTTTTTTTTRTEKRSSSSSSPSPSQLSFKELGLIDAMNVRFRSSFDNQTIGYRAYKERLQVLHETIIFLQQDDDDDDEKRGGGGRVGTGDVDIMAFLADSIMILYSNNDGYHFYNENDNITPYPEIAYAISLLEDCLHQSPDHPLCQHLYIHVTEPSDKITTNKVASNVADNLYRESNTSEAQHLQHMPSHIYLRIGRYHDAVISNIVAHESDEKYLNNQNNGRVGTPYGPGHDIAFLIHAAQHSGERNTAYRYSNILRNHYRKYPTKPDGPGTEQGWNIWRTVRLRFGDYQSVLDDNDDIDVNININVNGNINVDIIDDEVKNNSNINIQWPYAVVLGHYSKGIATLWNKNNTTSISINNTYDHDDDDDADDRVSEATKHLRSLRLLIPNLDPSFSGMARVANLTLTSAIEYYKYRHDYDTILPPAEILSIIRKARIEQDSWSYTEPPSWFNSVALCEGTLLRILGRHNEAVLTFQRDLEIIPESRYGLFGLKKAMIAAGTYSTKEVEDVSKRFDEASYWSDSSIRNSVPLVCPELRE